MIKTKKWCIKNSSLPALLLIVLIPMGLLYSLLLIFLSLFDPRSWRFNRDEAAAVLQEHLDGFRKMSKEEIRAYLAEETRYSMTVVGPSGDEYQLEVEELPAKEGICLLGSIDDGRLRAFFPLTQEIIIK